MTTKKQIKTLFDRLVARNDDLIVKNHYVFKVPYLMLRPVRHVSCSISIDRTSRADDPNFFGMSGIASDLSARWEVSLPNGSFCPAASRAGGRKLVSSKR